MVKGLAVQASRVHEGQQGQSRQHPTEGAGIAQAAIAARRFGIRAARTASGWVPTDAKLAAVDERTAPEIARADRKCLHRYAASGELAGSLHKPARRDNKTPPLGIVGSQQPDSRTEAGQTPWPQLADASGGRGVSRGNRDGVARHFRRDESPCRAGKRRVPSAASPAADGGVSQSR